jgi:hypothetical protein
VTVVSTIRSAPPMVADELRRQADNFIELQDIASKIQRSHVARDDHGQTGQPARPPEATLYQNA